MNVSWLPPLPRLKRADKLLIAGVLGPIVLVWVLLWASMRFCSSRAS